MNTQGIAPFELFAIRYAVHRHRQAKDNYVGDVDFHDAESDLAYYVWVARRGSEIYVIDTGFEESAGLERGRKLLVPVHEGLALLGVSADNVEHIILTHLHYDHAGSLDRFPNATFHIQDQEAAFATGRCMCHPVLRNPFNVNDILSFVRQLFNGKVEFHNGTAELTPGLTVHLVGGHTAGLQIVRVWTRRGWVVLASDASHLYGHMQHGVPFPIVHNIEALLEGHKRVLQLADSPDHVIPGHDPEVMRLYPAYSEATEGRIARLDVPPCSHND